MRNLILSCVQNYSKAQLVPFIESLNQTGCTAPRVMVCYDDNAERDQYLIDNGWGVARSVRDDRVHVMTQRFADWETILDGVDHPTMVLSTDCRDVVFQKDPFEMRLTSENVYVASEGIFLRDDPWTMDTCRANYPNLIDWYGDQKSYCAGTILGGGQLMKELFRMIFRLTITGLNHLTAPCDQPAFNILVNQQLTRARFQPIPWFACTCGTLLVDKFKDKLFSKPLDLGEYALVHQYERVPELGEEMATRYQPATRIDVINEPAKTGVYSGPLEIPAQNDNLTPLIMGRTVALVGPAKSLQGMGAEIDSADVVVRMNRGYPPAKRDWLAGGNRTDILYHCLLEEERCGGKIPWEELFADNLTVCSPYPLEVRPFRQDVLAFLDKNVEWKLPFHAMTRELYLELARVTGTRPNTGICAIVDLLAHRPAELRVYGFDFFETGWRESYKVDDRLPHYIATQFDGNHHQAPQKRLVEDLQKSFPLVVVKPNVQS